MKKWLCIPLAVLILASLTAMPVAALTEAEVQNQVNAVGKEAVTGNIFVWFLCAIAFLKVSQKIDSFMASLGINVGNTGGSMLTEALLAMRGFSMGKSIVGGAGRGSKGKGSGGSGGGSSSDSGGGSTFLQGGLAGAVGRRVTNTAVRNANGTKTGGLGGAVFRSSLSKGGGFANSVIGRIATGSRADTGNISGAGFAEALSSYLGLSPDGAVDSTPTYSDVEMGGGQIYATETSEDHPDGIAIGMYHADQYTAPEGEYTTVTTADGGKWYKQYATDTVERTPYKKEDDTVGYHERIIQRLPKAPPRKDRQ